MENPGASWLLSKVPHHSVSASYTKVRWARLSITAPDSFPVANGVKQGCVLAPTLFSTLFSLMLREAKEDLVDGIFIRFRTDGSIFNLHRLLAHTKTIDVLIVELLFADDCALLAHTQEILQYIVNRFAEAAKAFGFTISLKKTEVLHQPPPRSL